MSQKLATISEETFVVSNLVERAWFHYEVTRAHVRFYNALDVYLEKIST